MLWTNSGLVLVYLLGGIVGAAIAVVCMAQSARVVVAGVVAIVASLLGTVFTLTWCGWRWRMKDETKNAMLAAIGARVYEDKGYPVYTLDYRSVRPVPGANRKLKEFKARYTRVMDAFLELQDDLANAKYGRRESSDD